MVPRVHDVDLPGLVARGTLVVAPLLAFGSLPVRGGAATAMVFPALILAATLFTRPLRRIPFWELALLALLLLSVVWGDVPDYSGGRLRITAPVLAAAVVAASLVSRRTALRCLELSFALMVTYGVVLVIVSPAARVSDGYSGLAIHGQFAKNGFAGVMVLSLLLTVCARRRSTWLVAPVLIVLIVLTKSSTSLILVAVMLGGILVMRTLSRAPGGRNVSTLVWVAASGGALTVLAVLNADAVFLGVLGKDPTLSSRTEIWAACWTEIERAPILGHGAFTFLDSDSRSPVTLRIWSHFSATYLPPHPHNGLLDVWGQLGLVGVVVFAGLAVQILRSGVRGARLGDRTSTTALTCFVYVLLFGLTEVTYLGPWLVVTSVCAAAADTRVGTVTRRRGVAARSEGGDPGRLPETSPRLVLDPDPGRPPRPDLQVRR